MSGGLEDLNAVFTKYQTDKELDNHQTIKRRLDGIRSEFQEQFDGVSAELDHEEQEQVSQAFEQVAREDIEEILNSGSELGAFPERVDDIIDQLEDILRSPQAEAVVETLLNWLLSTGLEPLSEDKQDELREIIKDDIEAARQAVEDSRASHDSLRGYLGDAQEDIDQMVLQEVQNASSIADLESLAEGLGRLEDNWIGDWKLTFETEAGEDLYRELLDLLEDNLTDVVKEQKNLTSLAALLEKRSSRWGRNLDDVDENWGTIESRVDGITSPEGSFGADDALELVRNGLGPVPSINSYKDALNDVAEALQSLREVSHRDLEPYQPPDDSKPDEISDKLAEIEGQVENAREARNAVFDAESAEEIDDCADEFGTAFENLETEFEELKESVQSEIGTTRKLAKKFELDEDQTALNSQYASASGAESVTEIGEIFEEYLETENQVMEYVREELSETEEEIFTLLLEYSEEQSEEDAWARVVDTVDRERGSCLETLVSLQEKDLVDFEVSVV